jgi:hypothetical protein
MDNTTQHKPYSILVEWNDFTLSQLPKVIHKVEKLLSWVFPLSFYGLKSLAYISIKLLPSIRLLNENRIIWCTVISSIIIQIKVLQEFIKFLKMVIVIDICNMWNWLRYITTSPSPNIQLHIIQQLCSHYM